MNTEIVKITADDTLFDEKIREAADIIVSGGLVVFPTETVYGLGADATDPLAAKAIFKAKGRPSDNPLIIHIADPRDAEKYTHTNKTYYRLADKFMPGPLTVILKSKDTVPPETRAGLSTVAVRCPENIIARALIKASERAIAAPSANLSGSPSATTAQHVIDDMTGRVDMILDGGESVYGLESTIVKIDEEDSVTLLRPGKITVEELLSAVAEVKIADAVTDKLKDGEVALSPGMKYRHYAPSAPLELLDGTARLMAEHIASEGFSHIAVIAYEEDMKILSTQIPFAEFYSFGRRDDETEQAHLLFSILRDADKKNFDKIYAPLPKKSGIGLALYNRMIRAAAHNITIL